jgi:hypothetical protein
MFANSAGQQWQRSPARVLFLASWKHGRMKFAPNHLYIEEYVKCANCGVLIYEERAFEQPQTITKDEKVYCSQWCLDWERARETGTPPRVALARSP